MDHCIEYFSNLKIHNNKGFCYKSESKFCLYLCVEYVSGGLINFVYRIRGVSWFFLQQIWGESRKIAHGKKK